MAWTEGDASGQAILLLSKGTPMRGAKTIHNIASDVANPCKMMLLKEKI
jgi:hypothetical protein